MRVCGFQMDRARMIAVITLAAIAVSAVTALAFTAGQEWGGWHLSGVLAVLAGVPLQLAGPLNGRSENHRGKGSPSLDEYSSFIIKILEHYGDIIARFDKELRCEYISGDIERVTGVPGNKHIGKSFSDIYGSGGKTLEGLARKALSEQSIVTNYYEYKGPNGWTLFLLKIIPEKEASGAFRHILVIGRDITEFRTMQKELEKLDRLHLVGEIAASIGHEMRNPLTTVRGMLQLLSMKEGSSQFKERYRIMIEEIDHASNIITEFLSLAKNKNIVLKQINLSDSIREVLPLLERGAMLAGKLISVNLASEKKVFADEKEIHQLLIHLSDNGLDAMQPGETLLLETWDEGSEVLLRICDTGRGIPEHVLDKLGTPFVTTKERGTGLGLSICYSVASRHKAEIKMDTSSQGTTFTIRFPQAGTVEGWPKDTCVEK